MPTLDVTTYHCLCTELVVGTFSPIEKLPKRKLDGAAICKVAESDIPIPGGVVHSSTTFEANKPTILKLEDGFEKRYPLHCGRCEVQVGYWLDKSQFEEKESGMRDDVLYLLPKGLIDSVTMKLGGVREEDVDLRTNGAG